MNIFHGFIFFLVIGIHFCHSQENKTINALSKNYDWNARFEYSETDVLSFVYQWFSGFDHQKETGFFLKFLDDYVQMNYPDFEIKSKKDFIKWYEGVESTIFWNRHYLKNIKVKQNEDKTWNITYDVNWKAKDYSGKKYDLLIFQKLKIVRYGDIFKILQLDAEVKK